MMRFSFISVALAAALLASVATSVAVKAQALPDTDQVSEPTPTVDVAAPDPDPVVDSEPVPVVMTIDGVEEPPVNVVDDDNDFLPLLTSGPPQEQEDSGTVAPLPRSQEARNENQSSHDNYSVAHRPRGKSCLLKAFKISKSC
jgi:hypothetical protein